MTRSRLRGRWAAVGLVLAVLSPAAGAGEELDRLVDGAVRLSLDRLERSTVEVGDPARYPTYGTKQLRWQLQSSADWTSGFYPGCLWYAFALSRDPRFEQWARAWTAPIEREKGNRDTHDLGFRFMGAFGNGLRLGRGPGLEGYRDILHAAAATLAGRFNSKVGCLSSNWDRAPAGRSFPVVIDIMMNLELLLWSADHGGPAELRRIARVHADTTMRDFVRADGGTCHVVRYDPDTGAIINRGTLQGAGAETTWARGHAWALYGLVVMYRYTHDPRYLEMAERLADYFLRHLPADHVPPWDFQSEFGYRDVSAAAIVTAALLEMERDVEDPGRRGHYRREAEAMLAALCRPPWFAAGPDTNCLLDHSAQYVPLDSNVDVPAIFADYYFLEAVLRYRGLAAAVW
jgi:unsaturated chondroitin disaccharide hydrolase